MYAIDKIKNYMSKETILALMDKLEIPYSDNGDHLRAKCPIHGGDNPTAFNWTYDNGLWFCFTGDCGGGSILEFVREYFGLSNLSFPELVEKTASVLELDITGLSLDEIENSWVKDTRRWIKYMQSKRKNTNANIEWDINSLGTLYHINNYRQFDKEVLAYFNIYYASEHSRVAAIMHDEHGDCIGATMRATKSGQKPKWVHVPKGIVTGNVLYNLHRVNSKTVRVVEGVWDVVNMHMIGCPNTVATFGSHLTDEQFKLIIKNFTDVILMYDNDKAGRIATKRAIDMLQNVTNLYVQPLGGFNDPGEVTREFMENNLPIPSCKYKIDGVQYK